MLGGDGFDRSSGESILPRNLYENSTGKNLYNFYNLCRFMITPVYD